MACQSAGKRQRLRIIAPRPLYQLFPETPSPTVPETIQPEVTEPRFTEAADYQQTDPAEAASLDWIQLAWDTFVNEPAPALSNMPDLVERAFLEDELLASSAPDYKDTDFATQEEDWNTVIPPAGEGADVMPLDGSNCWADACLVMDELFPIVA